MEDALVRGHVSWTGKKIQEKLLFFQALTQLLADGI